MPSEVLQCDEIADRLGAIAEGEKADPATASHVESCLRCQAELVQYRKLLRSLHQLRTEVLDPAPGTLTSILAGLEAAGERGAIRSMLHGRRAAYAGGIALATAAAGAAGALVIANRARRRGLRIAS